MNGEKISRCLDALPDEMLSESMKPYRPRSLGWHIVRIAACLAIVIGLTIALWPKGEEPGAQLGTPTEGTTAAPTQLPTTLPDVPTEPVQKEIIETAGVLKLYACDAKNMDSIQREEYLLIEGMEPSYKTAWSPLVNLLTPGVTLTLVVDEESLLEHEITYNVAVNYGELQDSIYNVKQQMSEDGKHIWGKKHVAKNGETIRWGGDELYFDRPQGMSLEDMLASIERIHLDIIVRADDNIVGYAVLEMICTNVDMCIFNAVLVDSGYFPKVDGEFQNVTEEYVRELIEEKMESQAM